MKKSAILTVFAALVLILGLSACGKVSMPEPLEGSGYPHTYPRH